MCIGGSQPQAPVNKPDYAPEDAWKHFETSKTDVDGTKTAIQAPADPATAKSTSVPQVKPSQNLIRM